MSKEYKQRLGEYLEQVWEWLYKVKQQSFTQRLKKPWVLATAFILPTLVQFYLSYDYLFPKYTQKQFLESLSDFWPELTGIFVTLLFGLAAFLLLQRWQNRFTKLQLVGLVAAGILLYLIIEYYAYWFVLFDADAEDDQALTATIIVVLLFLTVLTLLSYLILAVAPFAFAYLLTGVLHGAEYIFVKLIDFPKGAFIGLCATLGAIGGMLSKVGY